MQKGECSTILIVDDEIGPRESLRVILKDEYNLNFAASGREGLRKIDETDADLVILDIRMPDLNGVDVLKELKDRKPDVEVIMLTGYGSYDSARAAVRHGAFDYIDKPFDVNVIRDVVRKALRRRRLALQSRKDLDELREINRELEKELLHMSKLAQAGKLSASAMHEISNPLAAVLGYINILQKLLRKGAALKEKDYDDSRRYLSVMERSIHRCNKFMHHHLTYSRTPNDSIEECCIGEAIESVALLIKPEAVKQSVKVTTGISGKPTRVKCNPDEIQHALMNIVFNALEAMPKRGELHIKSSPISGKLARKKAGRLGQASSTDLTHDRYITLTISDTGKGIPPEVLSRVFDPFFTRDKDGKGTGLGLAYARNVIEKGGGAIGVESTIGEGTTFHLFLPIVEG